MLDRMTSRLCAPSCVIILSALLALVHFQPLHFQQLISSNDVQQSTFSNQYLATDVQQSMIIVAP